jgi:hypothetical protein
MSFKHLFITLAIVVVIAVAIIVGLSRSEQATAAVGVICGAMASIPMSSVVLVGLQRLSKKQERERYPAQPPVVIVNPGSYQGSRFSRGPYFPLPSEEMRPRDFKIIGQDELVEAEGGERR